MNPRLRLILFIIFLATVVGIGIILFPKMLSLNHQVNGGQLLQSSLRSIDDVPDIGLTCVAIPKGKDLRLPELNWQQKNSLELCSTIPEMPKHNFTWDNPIVSWVIR
jgi:hypothetical protein